MTFVLDLVAMVFAMPRGAVPAMAEQVYGGGPQTAGLLYSALAVGALLGRCSPAGSVACTGTGSPSCWPSARGGCR
jgi:ENTS family enterobactin (siderophore) exporter